MQFRRLVPVIPMFIFLASVLLLGLRCSVQMFRERVEGQGSQLQLAELGSARRGRGPGFGSSTGMIYGRSESSFSSPSATSFGDQNSSAASSFPGQVRTGSVEDGQGEDNDDSDDGEIEQDNFHERHNTEIWVLRSWQVILFVLAYFCTTTLMDIHDWRQDREIQAMNCVLFGVIFYLISHFLPVYVPDFAALMAMPPYVDKDNMETFKKVLVDLPARVNESSHSVGEETIDFMTRGFGSRPPTMRHQRNDEARSARSDFDSPKNHISVRTSCERIENLLTDLHEQHKVLGSRVSDMHGSLNPATEAGRPRLRAHRVAFADAMGEDHAGQALHGHHRHHHHHHPEHQGPPPPSPAAGVPPQLMHEQFELLKQEFQKMEQILPAALAHMQSSGAAPRIQSDPKDPSPTDSEYLHRALATGADLESPECSLAVESSVVNSNITGDTGGADAAISPSRNWR